jgi:NADH-quinone oxidoreductase subunit N
MLLKLANYHNLLNYQWFPIGIILVTIGMFFKIAAVPFHFGRLMFMKGSTLTTALMSTLAKS